MTDRDHIRRARERIRDHLRRNGQAVHPPPDQYPEDRRGDACEDTAEYVQASALPRQPVSGAGAGDPGDHALADVDQRSSASCYRP